MVVILEYMQFEIGGFGGYTTINVHVKRGRVSYSVATMPSSQTMPTDVRVPKKTSDAWLSSLVNIHINRWHSDYRSECIICDGTQWSLEYKETEKRCRHICGDNAYPTIWKEFIEVMDTLAPEAVLIDAKQLERAEFSYHRHSEITPGTSGPNMPPKVIWDYKEKLTIDRKSETLTYKKNIGTGCIITHEYYVQDGVDDLLDTFENFFEGFDAADNSKGDDETPTLLIKLTRHNDEHNIYKRSYNRYGIPDEWDEFINDLTRFMSFYGLFGEIFDSEIFKHGVKTDEHIYCSVEFESGSKSYYYRTEDDSLKVDDRVVVPVGNDGRERIVTITNIEYFTEANVPLPLEKTKSIIRKLDDTEDDDICHCPLCGQDIDIDDCYDVAYHMDGLGPSGELPKWVCADKYEEQKIICQQCKYHVD